MILTISLLLLFHVWTRCLGTWNHRTDWMLPLVTRPPLFATKTTTKEANGPQWNTPWNDNLEHDARTNRGQKRWHLSWPNGCPSLLHPRATLLSFRITSRSCRNEANCQNESNLTASHMHRTRKEPTETLTNTHTHLKVLCGAPPQSGPLQRGHRN